MADRRRSLATERGAAAVELALVLPILVLLLFGIVEFSKGYSAKTQLTGAVREGARSLALGKPAADAEAAVVAAAPDLSITTANVTTGPTCPGGDASGNATVTATYAVTYDIPLFGSGTWNIDVTGVMRCGL